MTCGVDVSEMDSSEGDEARMMKMEKKSKILIFGGTGYIGKYLVKASVFLGHPTFVYARPLSPQTPTTKAHLHNDFISRGVTVIQGELEEQKKLVAALREVDVVISALPYSLVFEQLNILDAIKLSGNNIKRFIPSDFGVEEDRVTSLPPFEAFLEKKRKVRRVIENSGTPYTFVSANCFGSYFVNHLLHPHDQQDNTIKVYGTGEAKAVLTYEEDVAVYTIKVANDLRTCNKLVTYRPPKNIVSQLEMISLWEKKTGRTFDKIYISDQEIVKLSESLPPPLNIQVSILHSIFVKGDLLNYEVGDDVIEASKLYPDWDYTTFDHLLDVFLLNPPEPPTYTALE